MHKNNMLSLCVADKEVKEVHAWGFLADISKQFLGRYSESELRFATSFSFQVFRTDVLVPKLNDVNEKIKQFIIEDNEINEKLDEIIKPTSDSQKEDSIIIMGGGADDID